MGVTPSGLMCWATLVTLSALQAMVSPLARVAQERIQDVPPLLCTVAAVVLAPAGAAVASAERASAAVPVSARAIRRARAVGVAPGAMVKLSKELPPVADVPGACGTRGGARAGVRVGTGAARSLVRLNEWHDANRS